MQNNYISIKKYIYNIEVYIYDQNIETFRILFLFFYFGRKVLITYYLQYKKWVEKISPKTRQS